jgi:hypothetical protein
MSNFVGMHLPHRGGSVAHMFEDQLSGGQGEDGRGVNTGCAGITSGAQTSTHLHNGGRKEPRTWAGREIYKGIKYGSEDEHFSCKRHISEGHNVIM